MEWQIVPFESVGPLRFGDSEADVKSKFPSVNFKTKFWESDGLTLMSGDNFPCMIDLIDSKLERVGFWYPSQERGIFEKIDLLNEKRFAVVDYLRRLDDDTFVFDDLITFFSLGICLQNFHTSIEEDSLVGVFMFSRIYQSQHIDIARHLMQPFPHPDAPDAYPLPRD